MFTFPSALIDVLTSNLLILLISLLYGSYVAGQYSLAWRVLVFPSAVIGAAVAQIFFQKFAQCSSNKTEALNLLFKNWLLLTLVGILPFSLIFIWGIDLFEYFFGSEWSEAGKIASLLSPVLFFSFIHSPTSVSSIVLNLRKEVFFLSIIVLIYRIISFLIGWKYENLKIALIIYSILEIIQMFVFQAYIYYNLKNSKKENLK